MEKIHKLTKLIPLCNSHTTVIFFPKRLTIAWSVNAGREANFGECIITNLTFIGFEETSSYWSFQFFFVFNWAPSVGKPRMNSVFFIKTTRSYEVSLATINRQISYDSDNLRQDYGITRHLPMNIEGLPTGSRFV